MNYLRAFDDLVGAHAQSNQIDFAEVDRLCGQISILWVLGHRAGLVAGATGIQIVHSDGTYRYVGR